MGKDLTLFKDFWSDVPSLFDWNSRSLSKGWSRDFEKILNGKCDFEESEDSYTVELEVPGVNKDEIDIFLKGDNLTVSWSRQTEKKRDKKKNSRYERSEGSFTRNFAVEGADPDGITAELKKGVLKITLTKKASYKPKIVEIK